MGTSARGGRPVPQNPAGESQSGQETFLEFSMLRAIGTVRIALIFLMLLVLIVSPDVATVRTAAFFALFFGTILTIWTRFAARWRELQQAGHITTAAGVVLIADVTWISLFVLGTGGFASPFIVLLFVPIIFGSAFFSVLKLAAALVANLVTAIIIAFGLNAPPTVANTWRMFGMIFAAIAVSWIAYGLARVLDRERQTNELVVRHMSEGVVLIDAARRIRLVNPPLEKLTGIDGEDLVGSHVSDLPRQRPHTLLLDIIGDVGSEPGRANSVRDIELKRETSSTDLRLYTVRMGGGSRPAGWLIIVQDITDLKNVARARETGVRFLSHEMRSPLNTLKIVSQIFGELTGQLTGSNAERLVSILDSETDRMLRMVGQFLDLAALDQGTFSLALEKVDVGEIVTRVSQSLEVRAVEKQMSVERDIPQSLPPVNADPDRLEDVLHNLCDNALKYTDRGGRIRLSAAAAGGSVEVCVSDNGRGISPDIQDDIFSEFVRAAEDGKDGRRMGVGLGLYMARRIIEEHGGEITVESEVGKGSEFTIRLPEA